MEILLIAAIAGVLLPAWWMAERAVAPDRATVTRLSFRHLRLETSPAPTHAPPASTGGRTTRRAA